MIVCRLQLGVRVGLVGLQQLHVRGDGDRLGQRADVELHVDAATSLTETGTSVLHGLLEALQRHLDVVGPGLHVRERIGAGVAGHRRRGRVRFLVGGGDRGAGYGGAAVIRDGADEAAVQDLRVQASQVRRRRRATVSTPSVAFTILLLMVTSLTSSRLIRTHQIGEDLYRKVSGTTALPCACDGERLSRPVPEVNGEWTCGRVL